MPIFLLLLLLVYECVHGSLEMCGVSCVVNLLTQQTHAALLLSGDGSGCVRLWDLRRKRTVAETIQKYVCMCVSTIIAALSCCTVMTTNASM